MEGVLEGKRRSREVLEGGEARQEGVGRPGVGSMQQDWGRR